MVASGLLLVLLLGCLMNSIDSQTKALLLKSTCNRTPVSDPKQLKEAMLVKNSCLNLGKNPEGEILNKESLRGNHGERNLVEGESWTIGILEEEC